MTLFFSRLDTIKSTLDLGVNFHSYDDEFR